MIDGLAAQRTARELALRLGFGDVPSSELALVAAELASNLVKHAKGGTLTFTPIAEGGRTGIRIESLDHGPGIPDADKALADGFSTAGGLGLGLGTVNRLMDKVTIASTPHESTRVACVRWIRPKAQASTPREFDIGVATRARLLRAENGDAFVVQRWERQALVGVIDGLGHGPEAQRAALAARRYVEDHYDQPLEDIFEGTRIACRSTRGVVMALIRIETDDEVAYGSIGNVTTYFWSAAKQVTLPVDRGVIGAEPVHAKPRRYSWPADQLLVIHSDGVRSGRHFDNPVAAGHQPAQILAREILERFARDYDDATVLVAKH